MTPAIAGLGRGMAIRSPGVMAFNMLDDPRPLPPVEAILSLSKSMAGGGGGNVSIA